MLEAAGVLIVTLACAAASGHAAQISREAGPLTLKGVSGPMQGPDTSEDFSFSKPGWIRGFSVHILDAENKPADDRGIFCHGGLHIKDFSPMTDADRRAGMHEIGFRLVTAEGQNEIVFPKGFGLHVDSSTVFTLNLQLQNPDERNNGDYKFKVDLDVAYEGEGEPPTRTLRCLDVVPKEKGGGFHVPPGRHEFQEEFVMPFSGTVHYITAHVHQYLDTITLIDPASGEILNSIRLEHDARGWPRGFPAYSDAIGIRLVRGARYVVKMSFSNPREVPVDSFARVSLYAHRDDDR